MHTWRAVDEMLSPRCSKRWTSARSRARGEEGGIRTRRRRRRTLAEQLALLGVAVVLLPAPGWASSLYVNDVRDVCHLPRPGQNGAVLGHDLGISARVGTSVYWLFGDTVVDVNGDGLPGPGIETIAGSIAVSQDDDPSDCIDLTYKTGPAGWAEAVVPKLPGECTTWPGGGVEANGSFYVYYSSVPAIPGGCDYAAQVIGLARVTNPATLETERRAIIQGSFGHPIKIGSHVYLFSGVAGLGPRVARVREDLIEDPGAYEYWQGGDDWSGNLATSAPLFPASGVGHSLSIGFDHGLGRYLALFTCDVDIGDPGTESIDVSNGLCARVAEQAGTSVAALLGAWGEKSLLHHCRNDQVVFRCYHGFVHGAYSVPGGPTYVTSARNWGAGYWATLREFRLGTELEDPLREFYSGEFAFGPVAGKQGWSYLAGPFGPPLVFDPAKDAWLGSETVGGEKVPGVKHDEAAPGMVQPAVRAWEAPVSGTARISGEAWVERTCSDGVDLAVLKVAGSTTEVVWSREDLLPGQSALFHRDEIALQQGDRLAFQVARSGSSAVCDQTRFNPTIRFDPKTLRRAAAADWRDGSPGWHLIDDTLLAPMQGFRGWSFEECSFASGVGPSACAAMTDWVPEAEAWEGPSGPSSRVWSDGASAPSAAGKAAARTWTAPVSRDVRISGAYADACAPGESTEGVRLAIFKGPSTQLWQADVAGGESGTFDLHASLTAGDVLRFVVARSGASAGCSAARFAPVIEEAICDPQPRLDCRVPVHPRRAQLRLKNPGGDSGDALQWVWRGQATDLAAFGDPVAGQSSYGLCVYGQQATGIVNHIVVPLPGLLSILRACSGP